MRSFIQIRLSSHHSSNSSHEHQNHDENPNRPTKIDGRSTATTNLRRSPADRRHPQTAAIGRMDVSLNRYRHMTHLLRVGIIVDRLLLVLCVERRDLAYVRCHRCEWGFRSARVKKFQRRRKKAGITAWHANPAVMRTHRSSRAIVSF